MTTNKIVDVASKLVSLLEPLEREERGRAIQAAFVLLGDQPLLSPATNAANSPGGRAGLGAAGAGAPLNLTGATEKQYFDAKQPSNKIEELAVAARFREEVQGATETSRDDFIAVYRAARRNFDGNNYRRDIANARTKGLFNKNSGANAVLSHYGQGYVDALPDRDALKGLRAPRKSGAKRAAAKAKAKAKK
jgi:hypothetical protein